MPTPKPETVFDIEQLLTQLNQSFLSAARQLQETFESDEWKDSPFVYQIPKMHVSMKLELSHSNGKIKGFFGLGGSEQQTSQLVSTIDIDVVAAPRTQSKT